MNTWLQANRALSLDQTIQLLANGVAAVRRRCLGTLSGVTVAAVIERTLHECREKFPELNLVVCDANGFDFRSLSEATHGDAPEDVRVALTELLLDILDVFGQITADILTKYLHQELMTVTLESTARVSEVPVARVLSSSKKNREQK